LTTIFNTTEENEKNHACVEQATSLSNINIDFSLMDFISLKVGSARPELLGFLEDCVAMVTDMGVEQKIGSRNPPKNVSAVQCEIIAIRALIIPNACQEQLAV